jgi:hypothetical protein
MGWVSLTPSLISTPASLNGAIVKHKSRRFQKSGYWSLVTSACLGFAPLASAVSINVNSTATLLAAFTTAEKNPTNTYDINLARNRDNAGAPIPYKLTAPLTLSKGHVNLHGSATGFPQDYIIDGQSTSRLVYMFPAAGYAPTFYTNGITFQNGATPTYEAGGGFVIAEGAYADLTRCIVKNCKASQPGAGFVVSNATLLLHWVIVDGNINTQYPDNCGGGLTSGGGGMQIVGNSWVTITGSTFRYNKACRAGGIQVSGNSSSSLWIENSTFSGNEALYRGGAMLFQGGEGYVTMRFNTIAYNKAGTTTSVSEKKYGGGIGFWGFTGDLTFVGNILAKNTVTYDMKSTLFYIGSDTYWESGFFTPHIQQNYIGDRSNVSQLGSDLWWGIGWEGKPLDPLLNGLASNNGAKTGIQMPCHLPKSGSPVIAGYYSQSPPPFEDDWDWIPKYDQRGYTRPNFLPSSHGDIGSIEYAGVK